MSHSVICGSCATLSGSESGEYLFIVRQRIVCRMCVEKLEIMEYLNLIVSMINHRIDSHLGGKSITALERNVDDTKVLVTFNKSHSDLVADKTWLKERFSRVEFKETTPSEEVVRFV